MADDCEVAQENTDRWLAGAIAAAAVAKPEHKFVPNGKCRWCGDDVDDGFAFCPTLPGESGCRDDWEADCKRRDRAGGVR